VPVWDKSLRTLREGFRKKAKKEEYQAKVKKDAEKRVKFLNVSWGSQKRPRPALDKRNRSNRVKDDSGKTGGG